MFKRIRNPVNNENLKFARATVKTTHSENSKGDFSPASTFFTWRESLTNNAVPPPLRPSRVWSIRLNPGNSLQSSNSENHVSVTAKTSAPVERKHSKQNGLTCFWVIQHLKNKVWALIQTSFKPTFWKAFHIKIEIWSVYQSRTHELTLLASSSADWANGPLMQTYSKLTF